MARRFGSAIISNADSMFNIYIMTYIRVKTYKNGYFERVPRWRAGAARFGLLSVSQPTNRSDEFRAGDFLLRLVERSGSIA